MTANEYAELKDFLATRFARIDARFDRLEARMDAMLGRMDSMLARQDAKEARPARSNVEWEAILKDVRRIAEG